MTLPESIQPTRWITRFFWMGLVITWMPCQASAQTPSASTDASMTSAQAKESFVWMSDQFIRYMPKVIDGDEDWGETKRLWAGVKLRRDGIKLTTKRRWKEVRHGRWVKYQIDMSDALKMPLPQTDDSHLSDIDPMSPVQIESVVPAWDAESLAGYRVKAFMEIPAKFSVRIERWNLGVQWYSVNITGKLTVRLTTQSVIGVSADYAEIPPAMQLNVRFDDASLAIKHFEVERISKLGGDAAEELGDLAENTIGKIWLRKENQQLASRLNKLIEKHQEDLRWSIMDWLAQLAE